MNTFIKALVISILMTASFSTMAVERFKRYLDPDAKVVVCVSSDAAIDLINAKRANDQYQYNAIMRQECKVISQKYEFTVTANNRYISEVQFYNGQCVLDQDKYYISNEDIMNYSAQEIQKINETIKSFSANRTVRYIEPPICGKPVASTPSQSSSDFLRQNTVSNVHQQDQDNQGD